MKINPFYPNDPIPPNLFVGRNKEVNTIKRSLGQTLGGRPESVLVIGARGSGKTSLVQYASMLEADAALASDELGERTISVLVRCGGMTSISEFCTACIDKIKASLQTHSKIWNAAKSLFEEVEIDTWYVKIKAKDPGSNPTTEFSRILKKIWNSQLAEKYGALQLLIDETDDISACPEFPGFIKNTVETIKERPIANIQLVITIVDEKLKTVVKNHESFPRIFHIVNLGPLSETELELVVNRCLADGTPKVAVDKFAIRFLKIFTAGIPNYLHQFCHEAFEVNTDDVIGIDDVFTGAHGTADILGSFAILWEKHFRQKYAEDMQSPYKRKILHVLSLMDEPASNGEISKLYREIFKEKPSSNITVYLSNMCQDGAIKRFGRGTPYMYQIADPRLRVLLRFFPGTNPEIYDRINDYMLSDVLSKVEQ